MLEYYNNAAKFSIHKGMHQLYNINEITLLLQRFCCFVAASIHNTLYDTGHSYQLTKLLEKSYGLLS